MEDKSVPILSRNDIELKAEEVIEYFDKNILEKPQFTPLGEFVDKLKNEFNVQFDFIQDLGNSSTGKKILGKFLLKPRTIFIDKSVMNSNRFPYTLAHELGHLVLHRKVKLSKDEYNTIVDTEIDFVSSKKLLKTSRDWVEWQANQFASAILMPRKTFTNAVEKIQVGNGINKNTGFIYLENEAYSRKDFKKIVDELEIIYRVNRTNIEYRMKDLGILIDNRLKDVKHISEFLKEE